MKSVFQTWDDTHNLISCSIRNVPLAMDHYHSRIEMYYALTEGVTFRLNGDEIVMKKDSFLIADSFDAHSSTGDGEYLCLIISEKFFDTYKKARGQKTLKQKYFTDEKQTSRLYSILCEIKSLVDGGEYSFVQMEGLIKYLLGTVLSFTELVDVKASVSYDALKDVLVFINENFRDEISLDDVSKSLGLNRHYVSHLLGKSGSGSFNDYVNGLRVEYVVNNIGDADSVAQMAFESGFQSLATFYRAFEKVYGCSPKKFFLGKNGKTR
ncbi:MAG: AraC family transcriptional regulator [Clostridia bacterium]|nr:AraC family transcriptional regulator [Clostridia bacterium]